MKTSTLLKNLYYNLIGCRSKRVIFISLVVFYVAYKEYCNQKKLRRRLKRQKPNNQIIKNQLQPLIAFGGGGLLGMYYIGIIAYLNDNFDLSNTRVSGISVGSTVAAAIAHGLPTEASIIFGLKWFKLQADRPLKCLLIKPSEFCRIGMEISNQFGITDECAKLRNDNLYIGVTNIATFPFKHEILNGDDIPTRYDTFYAMSCSCRILPFFTVPGYYKGMWLLDGGLSATYSIPKDANPDKIIRISVSSRIYADIQPDAASGIYFKWIDAITTPSLDQMCEQFKRGYNDALRCKRKLIAKGLTIKSMTNGGNINNLDSHLNLLKLYGKQIFSGEFRDEDLSYLMNN